MAEPAKLLSLTIAMAPAPRQVREQVLCLPSPATVMQALRATGWLEAGEGVDLNRYTVSVWGRRVGWEQALREGDRIELCRSLVVDPKVARRERFAKQGARGTGLFARRRPGAAAGYGA